MFSITVIMIATCRPWKNAIVCSWAEAFAAALLNDCPLSSPTTTPRKMGQHQLPMRAGIARSMVQTAITMFFLRATVSSAFNG